MLHCHGDMDPMVPFMWGSKTAALLKQLNPEHELIKLPGVQHSGSAQVRTQLLPNIHKLSNSGALSGQKWLKLGYKMYEVHVPV